MSQENVEIVKRAWDHFLATGEQLEEMIAPDFIWDMSTYRDLVGMQARYIGIEGINRFLQDWTEPFDQWQIAVDAFHDAGDRVVTVCRQHARSRTTGMPVEMRFAMVWTVRNGRETYMAMYADPEEAFKAAGLEE
jgi:ketosteroid isomerase-like protein